MFNFFKKKSKRIIYPTFDKGFHGDEVLIDFTNSILKNCKYFIETGSAEATTLSFVSRNHRQINSISCEADTTVYVHAKKQIASLPNADLRNEHSPDFLYSITKQQPEIVKEKVCFWLDAHGYGFKWPLRDEVNHILKNYSQAFIFIDDFKVPGQPQFGYDVYDDQECSLDYLSDIIGNNKSIRIYFPKYQTTTSEYHPLRGWVLIENTSHVVIPKNLEDDIFSYLF